MLMLCQEASFPRKEWYRQPQRRGNSGNNNEACIVVRSMEYGYSVHSNYVKGHVNAGFSSPGKCLSVEHVIAWLGNTRP
jgi:hypothetical protein